MHLSGEAVDTVADYLTIFTLIFVPVLLIYLFSMVHIIPEKIAHKRHHPQADAVANVPTEFWKAGADMQINTRFDLIGIRNERLANRVGLHLALGGGVEPPPTP